MADDEGAPGLSGEELQTWAALATVLEWLPPALDAQLGRDADLTHFEYGVLFALGDAPGRTLRMSVLAGYANSTLTRLSRAVGRLEKRGWVQRAPDPSDGRSTLAMLTAAGVEKLEQATPGHVRVVRHVLGSLTRAQVRQLREISRRLLGALREEEGWQPSTPPTEAAAPVGPGGRGGRGGRGSGRRRE
ncbi:MarR family winged helix-turn-helix transcriptional regulator [Microlunatus capsulatus]|uniref:DNA-binding MarR family transcriptional regulator n=1 Tax=Microlunatus capsulatus TaxID=99117 RepID=A0ABS4Z2S8_9ACTN|nr:MarR family transcriptional regulator [Microlunatus capsulatus]MBP2415330.1 DNA-binding MarR family transcriptional regulator [Microlunatus capsulatus]